MGLIERLKQFFGSTQEKNISRLDNDLEFEKTLCGEDPYYSLFGHHLTNLPENKDDIKVWKYNGKIKRRSEWEKLGFEIEKLTTEKWTKGESPYYIRLLTIIEAERMLNERKDDFNIYEQIQQEKESNKITLDNTIYWIKHYSENVISSLDYTPKTLDFEDIKVTFDDMIESLNYLKNYEHCENFFEYSDSKEKPSIIYDKLINNFEAYLLKIIENSKNYIIEKASKMKTKEGRINTFNRFLDKLIECKSEITHEESIQRYNLIVNEVNDLLNAIEP